MLFEPLPQRGGRRGVVVFEGRHALRRRRHPLAEDGFEDPLAAADGAGAVGVAGGRQDGGRRQHAAAAARGDFREVVAGDGRQAVVLRQPRVDQQRVAVQEVRQRAAAGEGVVQRGDDLEPHGRGQRVVEPRKRLRVRPRHVRQSEPLQPEVLRQRAAPRVRQHPGDLLVEDVRLKDRAGLRDRQQFRVRQPAPQEQRQPLRHLPGADPRDAAVPLEGLVDEQELRGEQHRLQRRLDGRHERAAVRAAEAVQVQQPVQVRVRDGPPVRPRGEGADHAAGGLLLVAHVLGSADDERLVGQLPRRRGLFVDGLGDRLLDHPVRRGEQLFGEDRAAVERAAVGVEALAAGGVRGEVVRGAEVERRQVADGVVVLGPREAAALDVAAVPVARLVGGDDVAGVPPGALRGPVGQLDLEGLRHRLGAFRRHLAAGDPLGDAVPDAARLVRLDADVELVEVEAALRVAALVAVRTRGH